MKQLQKKNYIYVIVLKRFQVNGLLLFGLFDTTLVKLIYFFIISNKSELGKNPRVRSHSLQFKIKLKSKPISATCNF